MRSRFSINMANVAKILLSGLRRRGFVLSPGPDWRTLFAEPFSQLTEAHRAALREHKETILDLLWHEESPGFCPALGWPDDPRPPTQEWWDEEWQQWRTVQPERSIVCLNLLPTVPDPPEPPIGVPILPPPGVVLHYQDKRGRRCHADGSLFAAAGHSAVYRWCWEGGPRWFYAE